MRFQSGALGGTAGELVRIVELGAKLCHDLLDGSSFRDPPSLEPSLDLLDKIVKIVLPAHLVVFVVGVHAH